MFDETALYLEREVTDDKGKLNWNKIKWEDDKGDNKDLMEFIKKSD